ncbi:vicilin-like seed storage protein At2g18540, partial [Colossoma macropomum]|uniref:vicilin-like seed storage protein At2g18540 n=1 Tax=Colossoma macropomum TaxID=42526 RepID=UPI001864A5C8
MESVRFDETHRELEEAREKLRHLKEREKQLLGQIKGKREKAEKMENALQIRWEKHLLSENMEMKKEIKKKNKELEMLRMITVEKREEEQRRKEEEKREEEQRREEETENFGSDEIHRELEEAREKVRHLKEREKQLLGQITAQTEKVQKMENALQIQWEKRLISQIVKMEKEIKKKNKELETLRKSTVEKRKEEQ